MNNEPDPRLNDKLAANHDARIDRMKANAWIGYDTAIGARNQLETLLRYPQTHRMPNLALIGESNNGKTMILRNFCGRVNPPGDPMAEKSILPVIMIDTPPNPKEGRLYYAILERLCAQGSPREPEDSKRHRIRIILSHLETRMLVLDDFFNVGAGSMTSKRQFLNALRSLGNYLGIPIVVSGTPETLSALSIDDSIANRFKPVFLPDWDGGRLVEFARFVKSIEPSLLLRNECDIYQPETLRRLMTLGGGRIGEVVEILRVLAGSAIDTCKETISAGDIDAGNLKKLGWVSPADRSRRALF